MRPVLFVATLIFMTATSSAQTETAVLAGGCFWCLDAAYQMIEGVTSVVPGYAGGHTTNPAYPLVSAGITGHAEVVRVEFDPSIINYAGILKIFWGIHDPTTKNRQGNDIGSQYRSMIFYGSEAQKRTAEQSMVTAQKLWDNPTAALR